MLFTFQVEKWQDIVAELDTIFPHHWQELGLDRDVIKMDCDYARYQQLQDIDMLHITTVRNYGRLVGYTICFIIHHYHYKSAGLMAMTDMYYILPEYRVAGCGVKLFKEMERGLRARGVVRAHTSCKVHQDHQELFERLGWKYTDKTFSKMLGG